MEKSVTEEQPEIWDVENVNIEEVINSVSGPDFMEERAVGCVRQLTHDCRNGFLLQHAPQLTILTEKLAQQYLDYPSLWESIISIVKVASLPMVSIKQSDFTIYEKYIAPMLGALISPLGFGLPDDRPGDNYEQLRIEISYMLSAWTRFAIRPDVTYSKDGEELMKEGTPNLRILYRSGGIDDVTKCFRYEKCPEVIIILLGAFRDMSLYLPLAKRITNTGVLSNLLQIIRSQLMGTDILLLAAEVLWNVLELDWYGAAVALQHSIDAFYEFMCATLPNGFRFKDKVFRNDIMVMTMYLSNYTPNRRPFAETGLMAVLLHAGATARYSKQIGEKIQSRTDPSKDIELKPPLGLTWNQEDNEFRVLLWQTVATCCSDPQCLAMANDYYFIPTLLSFLDVNDEFTKTSAILTEEQNKLLRLAALSSLFVLFGESGEGMSYNVDAVTYFVESHGPEILLQLMGVTQDEDLRLKTLRVLLKAATYGCDLDPQTAMSVFVPLFHCKEYPMELRQVACSIISTLCEKEEHRVAFRREGGVEKLAASVYYSPDSTMDHHLYYTVSIVNLVWASCVGSRKNELRFLDADGFFYLLTILEIGPMVLKSQIIGCLADFLDSYQKKYAKEVFMQWNSKLSSKSALRILLELWQRDQNNVTAIQEDGIMSSQQFPLNPGGSFKKEKKMATGVIVNSPLMNSKEMGKFKQKNISQEDFEQSYADVLPQNMKVSPVTNKDQEIECQEKRLSKYKMSDCRARIYAVISKIGYDGHESLTTTEKQALEIIKIYLDCEVLEKWITVRQNLKDSQTTPLAADTEWMEKSIEELTTKTKWVQSTQSMLMDNSYAEDYTNLANFYTEICT